MSDQLRYIVEELKKEPFNRKNINLITFDDQSPIQLLQVLSDVFAEISGQGKVDLRNEEPGATVNRMMSLLRVLKYKFPNPDPQSMKNYVNQLIKGDKSVIYPILHWALQKMPELKKRAYLARFLVKIEIPLEYRDDPVNEIYEQYDELLDTFKQNHKAVEELRKSVLSVSEIKKDISHMEEEKDQLEKRIRKMQKRIEGIKDYEKMLNVARELRKAKEEESKYSSQYLDQNNQLRQAEQKLQRIQRQLKDMQQAAVGMTPEVLIDKIEEENRVNYYLCNDKLPKEIASSKKLKEDLEKVLIEPAMSKSDLDAINNEISSVTAEVNGLIEKRMVRNDPIDDKLAIFRQQASIMSAKKEDIANKLQKAMENLSSYENECKRKSELLNGLKASGTVMKGDEFKVYVNKLRGKSNVYKKKRQDLAEIRAEHGVLARTEEVLKNRNESIESVMTNIETKKGVSGYFDTQEELEKVSSMKSEIDDIKNKTLNDISEMVQKLNITINRKKSALAPIIKELRPLRQECQEVRVYREECANEEGRYHYLNCMMKTIKLQQQRLSSELKSYIANEAAEKKKSLRDVYGRKIQEQENLGKGLKEKQKSVKEGYSLNMKQMKMWKDLTQLIECKRQCEPSAAQENINSGFNNAVINETADHLVL
ncbi:Intraflagellar transport protein 81-like protein [Trichoplax sp. H2]|nr:Intraflagellar transport protein 81-like protein [Trichoplax sp. H2]|eukprot:RDD46608.1 Intraflagellar transport protein 81-like protein [Trichoplax sp. H2]